MGAVTAESNTRQPLKPGGAKHTKLAGRHPNRQKMYRHFLTQNEKYTNSTDDNKLNYLGTNLVTALASLEVDNLTHDTD